MDNLDYKIKEIFPNESVLKMPDKYSIFHGKNIPSFIKDWLIKKFMDTNGDINISGLIKFMEDHIPQKGNNLKGKLITDRKQIKVLARILIEPDIRKGFLKFSIPDLGIRFNEGIIPQYIVKEYPELKGGEVWGVVSLSYVPPENSDLKHGYIELIDYKPFKPYKVDLSYYKEARKEFSTEEWIDLLIRSMEYNPKSFNSLFQKLEFISRLLIFVEPRLNLIELAPKGTGKSYVFGNLSKYGWIVSGGTISRAKLFYDISKNMPGIITQYDFVAFDEIQTIKFTDENELRGALKSYLESGTFSVGNIKQTSNAGVILLGNIEFIRDEKSLIPKNPIYFKNLPRIFLESALLDRFHGFIEGWKLPRINEDLKVKGFALNVEYFSEVLHNLRDKGEYAAVVDELIKVPHRADTRDVTAIKRITTAYLKLIFPNVEDLHTLSKDSFDKYCLSLAKERRKIIREQIHLIDPEYSSEVPDISI